MPTPSLAATADAHAAPDDAALAVLDDPLEQQRFTRWTVDSEGRRIADSSLRISGMHCAACAGLIEQALAGVPGVREATVSAAGERARVQWDPARASLARIVQAIRAAGYDAAPDAGVQARELRRREHRAALWRLFVAAFCAMQVMMMATPSYVAHGDELAPDLRNLLNWGSWLMALPVLAFAAGPFFSGAWRSLRQRTIGMDVPVALGIAVTFIASSGATFDPGGVFGREVFFDSMTMFISFLLGGRYLELRARHRAAQALEDTMSALPQSALRVADDGSVQSVSVHRLVPGDRVRVPVGQAFPADGVLLEGSTRADEALLSGESVPVPKPAGSPVIAGSHNLGAPVLMRVERVGPDTRLEGIVAMMRDAMSQRPALARSADRWAAPFLWMVLLLAAGAAAAWSVIDPSRAVWVAVSVLIVTCPCALSLAAPAALLSAAGAMARRGVLVQRLDAIEVLARAGHLVFDKTGTLTDDRMLWRAMARLDGGRADAVLYDDRRLREAAAALAAWSAHPLSTALAQSVPASALSFEWRGVAEQAGAGLQALDADGQTWRLGAASFCGADASQADEGAAVWLAIGGVPRARFEFDEALRADAVEAVHTLRARGLKVTLLSGDRDSRAQRMGTRLQVDDAFGDATPQTKLDHVSALQARGDTVVMVGDGINDAPVLARADMSVAMGQGALVARAHADAIVVSGRLSDLVGAHERARRAMRVVRQNIGWAVVYNLACIPLALVGWLPPWAAGLGMAASSLLVIANAMRLAAR